ncbi:hypothetical protein ACMYSQ_012642 [Aspergillus niger]
MSSQHPDAKGGWKPKPLSALRRPSSLLKPTNPTVPLNRTTPPHNDQPLHQIPITYSTIAARALSFHDQVLTDITPVQLAQNGLYCKLLPGFGGTACCFACGSTKPLYKLQKNSIEEMQQLHLADCIWQIICRDLKPVFETPASVVPEESSTVVIDSVAAQSSITLEPDTQQPQSACSPEVCQPLQPLQPPETSQPPHSTITTSSAQDQRRTYASVLQRPKPSLPQSSSEPYQSAPSTKKPTRILSIEDLYRRFHNRPSPFISDKKPSKLSARRARNRNTFATQTLTRFLISALPTLSQLLAEIQPADNCWPPYPRNRHSRATRAA